MRIAYFTDTYLPNRDGVVTSIVNFRRELEKNGHEVYIFSPGSRQAKRENRDRRVFLYTSATFKPYPDYKVALFPFFSSSKVRELKIEMVHSHGLATMGLAAYAAAKRLGLPNLASFHTLVPEAAHYISNLAPVKRLMGNAMWRYLKWYYNLFETTTAPSHYTANMLEQHGISARVLPNGIDTQRFTPKANGARFKKAYGIDDRTVFMHVGRVAFEKNIDLLIDSALIVREEVPDALFVIAGTGPAREYYMRRVAEKNLGKFFLFTGFVPDELLPSAYASCDVLAFPSKFETQGLVALEAMACAKPVAAAAQSATAELIKPGKNGYLFGDSADECADKLVLAAEKSKRMGKAAREKALEYSNEKCTERLVKLYNLLL